MLDSAFFSSSHHKGGIIEKGCFFARHPPTFSQREQKNFIGMRPIVRGARSFCRGLKKQCFFPLAPLSPTAALRLRSGWAPAHAAWLLPAPAPPVARACFVRSSAGKGFASANAPLPFVPSLCLSAPSASLRRGHLRAAARLKSPSPFPSALHPPSFAPRGSPSQKPFCRFRSKRGAFAAFALRVGRLTGSLWRPPLFWGVLPAAAGAAPFPFPRGGKRQEA